MTKPGAPPASGTFLLRFFVPMAAFVVIGVVLPLVLVIPEQRSALSEQARATAITTSEMAAHMVASALGTGQPADAKEAVAALKRLYPSFGSISITNRAGKVVADTDASHEGKLEVDLFPPPVSSVVRTGRAADGTPLLEMTVPLAVGDDVRGAMRAAVRIDHVSGTWAGLEHLGALTICLLGIGFLVSLHLARKQVTPTVVVRERIVTERVEEKPVPVAPPASDVLSVAFEGIPAAVLVVDEVTRNILHTNGAFCRLWGFEDDASKLRDADYDTVAKHCNAATERPVLPYPLGAVELDPLRLVDEEIRCRDGRVVHCFSRPLAHAGRHVRLYVCSDVSAERRREVDLTSATSATRTALATKATFVAQLSRTLRAPLDGLLHTVDLLAATSLTPQQDTYADIVRTTAVDVRSMVDNILDLCAIDAGELHVSLADVELSAAVHESVEPFAARAYRKGVELIWTIADTVPRRVSADGDRLRQILRGLLQSAVQATDHGEIVVRVSAGAADVAISGAGLHIARDGSRTRAQPARPTATRATLRFEVCDGARGISADEHATLARVLSGENADAQYRTHLPLLVAKQLVELMEGHIGIDHDPGRGSTLWFTVPVQVDPTSTAQSPSPNDVLSTSRVLIVDDNATVRGLLEHQIRGWHIPADSAVDGADALQRLRGGVEHGAPYTLALIDTSLPDMDGIALVDAIHRDAKLADVAIFLLVAGPPAPDAPEAGVAATLSKPINPAALYEALVARVAAKGARRTVASHAAAVRKSRPRARLLLAEDNIVNQKIAVRMLDKLGYQTDVVTNGRDAVEAAQRQVYDAVLMDCQMPEMDGITATSLIRKGEGTAQHVPIIAVTANAMEADRERCLAAGMDDVLAKPVKAADLDSALRRWISSKETTTDGSEHLRLAPRAAHTA